MYQPIMHNLRGPISDQIAKVLPFVVMARIISSSICWINLFFSKCFKSSDLLATFLFTQKLLIDMNFHIIVPEYICLGLNWDGGWEALLPSYGNSTVQFMHCSKDMSPLIPRKWKLIFFFDPKCFFN